MADGVIAPSGPAAAGLPLAPRGAAGQAGAPGAAVFGKSREERACGPPAPTVLFELSAVTRAGGRAAPPSEISIPAGSGTRGAPGSEHLLDSYSVERSAVGDEVLKMAATLTTVGTMKNPVAQTLRNLAGHIMLGISPAQHAFADKMTEVTLGYPKSPLNGSCLPVADPKPGQRVGPVSGQVPVGAGSAPRFALFAANTTATADLVRRFPGLLDRDVRPPFRDGGVWLVRPDGYLACSSSDTEAVANYLDRLLHARTD